MNKKIFSLLYFRITFPIFIVIVIIVFFLFQAYTKTRYISNEVSTIWQNISPIDWQPALYAWEYQWRKLLIAVTSEDWFQWKTTNDLTVDASNSTDGRLNTGTFNPNHPASEYCQNLDWAWYSDWYLPAMDPLTIWSAINCSIVSWELQFLYCNHIWTGTQSLLGFEPNFYWASNQHDTGVAMSLWFQMWGIWTTFSPTNIWSSVKVRCIRVLD